MNAPENHLDRLLEAAGHAPLPLPEMPFGFPNRVLANCRAMIANREPLAVLLLLRQSLVFATLVMLAALAISFGQFELSSSDEVALSNATLNGTWMP